MKHPLILASVSPQRRTLLQGLDVPFRVVPSKVDESLCEEKDPRKRAQQLARLKARDVASRTKDSWVVGCDTLVVASDRTLLEKPRDAREAASMINRQSGKTSRVISALCLISPDGKEWSRVSVSQVKFRTLQLRDVRWWISTGLWEGRSGAFQIDGIGQLMIREIRGDWTSIVGLPVYALGELFRKAKAPFVA